MPGRAKTIHDLHELAKAERAANPHPEILMENAMADDKMKVGGQDRTRINLSEDYEVKDWCNTLGVSESQLREAVAAAGDQAAAVKDYLSKKR